MKKILFGICFILGLLNGFELKAEGIISIASNSSQWKDYGKVTILAFQKYNALDCIGDNFWTGSISDRFYELENEDGHLLKPDVHTVDMQYRYIDGERQYRMQGSLFGGDIYETQVYIYYSPNPYTIMDYVVYSNNRPSIRKKNVSSYSHFAEYKGSMYFMMVY